MTASARVGTLSQNGYGEDWDQPAHIPGLCANATLPLEFVRFCILYCVADCQAIKKKNQKPVLKGPGLGISFTGGKKAEQGSERALVIVLQVISRTLIQVLDS